MGQRRNQGGRMDQVVASMKPLSSNTSTTKKKKKKNQNENIFSLVTIEVQIPKVVECS
jgi:hypothetical protein